MNPVSFPFGNNLRDASSQAAQMMYLKEQEHSDVKKNKS